MKINKNIKFIIDYLNDNTDFSAEFKEGNAFNTIVQVKVDGRIFSNYDPNDFSDLNEIIRRTENQKHAMRNSLRQSAENERERCDDFINIMKTIIRIKKINKLIK